MGGSFTMGIITGWKKVKMKKGNYEYILHLQYINFHPSLDVRRRTVSTFANYQQQKVAIYYIDPADHKYFVR